LIVKCSFLIQFGGIGAEFTGSEGLSRTIVE